MTQDKQRHVFDGSPYSTAVALAAKWHAGQMDDDGLPHLAHTLRVAESLPDHLKPAGVLHDVMEDTDCTFEQIRDAVDGYTAVIVERLTKSKDEVYAAYIDRIAGSTLDGPNGKGSVGAAVRAVKLADLRDNLERSLNESNWSRVVRYTQAMEKLARKRTS